ncbi:hypothetical protein QAD02_002923 [Eretmocerus hayati]|uniref:Uncharacterized protein n=1 Tax=Eretmocerus hayati TaxID=131215 RepID=A0ACC2NK82_9HYME|nr:hypothetical protein QAD02_002923 [Eretmocerus hayati]
MARYNRMWDPSIVLGLAETWFPLEDLSMQQLTEEVVILLALATAHRLQTFAKIDINDIIHKENELQIEIPDLIKTSGPGRYQPLLILPRFQKKPALCVASTVEKFLERTKQIRDEAGLIYFDQDRDHQQRGVGKDGEPFILRPEE